MNRGRLGVILIWCGVLLVSYVFFIPQTAISSTEYDVSPHGRLVDAVVLIAMGKMAEDSMIDFSISSIRKIGNWKGDIYMLTDRKACFVDATANYDVKLIEMQPVSSIIQIKALKPKLLQYLPLSVNGALYLDVDILVTRDLGAFLTDLKETVTRNAAVRKIKSKIAAEKSRKQGGPNIFPSNMSMSVFDYGAFLDAKGHYVGFCSGCEKWHTGVVWLQRQQKGEGQQKLGEGEGKGVVEGTELGERVKGERVIGEGKGVGEREVGGKTVGYTTSLGPPVSSSSVSSLLSGNKSMENKDVKENKRRALNTETAKETAKETGKDTAEAVKSQVETGNGSIEVGKQSCMAAWEGILLSGKYTTDQESLDEAERVGACPAALTLPSKHLLFAKDYIGMLFTAGQTFLHLTAAGRIESQDYFYREIIVPRLRNSLRPTLNPHIIKIKKTC